MYYLIYKITNTVNNKIYIGKHMTDDINDDYMGSGSVLKSAKEKYGIDKFKKEILFECSSEEEMNEKERQIVNEEFISRLDTYNIKLGGDGGWDFVNSSDKQTEYAHKRQDGLRRKFSSMTPEEYKDYIYKMKSGIKRFLDSESEEDSKKRYEKISNGLKKYYKTHKNPNLGIKRSDEFRKRMSLMSSLNNNMRGKMWIYNLETKENKIISKNEEIPSGWIKGRWINK